MRVFMKFLKYLFILYFFGWVSDSAGLLIVRQLKKIDIVVGVGFVSNIISLMVIFFIFILPAIRKSRKKSAKQ